MIINYIVLAILTIVINLIGFCSIFANSKMKYEKPFVAFPLLIDCVCVFSFCFCFLIINYLTPIHRVYSMPKCTIVYIYLLIDSIFIGFIDAPYTIWHGMHHDLRKINKRLRSD